MKYLKSYNESFQKSNYNIYRIRFYGDGINVVKGKFDADPVQHRERAEEYVSFYWRLVKLVTGEDARYYHRNYMLYTNEVVNEILKEKYDIRICGGEEYYWWFIPKSMPDVCKWVETECKLPIRKMLRTPNFSSLDSPNTDWFRKESEKFTKEMKDKHPELYK